MNSNNFLMSFLHSVVHFSFRHVRLLDFGYRRLDDFVPFPTRVVAIDDSFTDSCQEWGQTSCYQEQPVSSQHFGSPQVEFQSSFLLKKETCFFSYGKQRLLIYSFWIISVTFDSTRKESFPVIYMQGTCIVATCTKMEMSCWILRDMYWFGEFYLNNNRINSATINCSFYFN